MFCNYCRALNPNDAVYCSACGQTIRVSAETQAQERKTQEGLAGQSTGSIPPPTRALPEESAVAPAVTESDNPQNQAKQNDSDMAQTITSEPPISSLVLPTYGTMGQRFTAYFADLIV